MPPTKPALSTCIILLFMIAISTTGCGPAKYVAPLDKGQWSASASLGGPLIQNLNTPMPMPLSAAGAGYGLTEKLTLFSDIQLTEAGYGIIHLNVGAIHYFNEPGGMVPGISSTVLLNNAISTRNGVAKIWPQLDVTARWPYGQKQNIWYGGVNNFFELSAQRAHGEPQDRHWMPALMAGHVFTGEKWDFNVEGKFMAPFSTNDEMVVEYIGVGNHGSFGLYFGATRKF